MSVVYDLARARVWRLIVDVDLAAASWMYTISRRPELAGRAIYWSPLYAEASGAFVEIAAAEHAGRPEGLDDLVEVLERRTRDTIARLLEAAPGPEPAAVPPPLRRFTLIRGGRA